ncbi:exonuclease [Natrialbaceae archaeon GCM10025810]|uniref:exonuclease n=1 Tax=Halovalidus salilacus TaxID=3075124 RepID=UPI0036210B45
MSTEDRPDAESDVAAATASAVERATFVRIVTRPDGDALAASGIVARALEARGTPFQVTVGRTIRERTERAAVDRGDDGSDLTLVVGAVDGDVTRLDAGDRPATLEAADLATELGTPAEPALALAGLVAAGVDPGAGETEWLLERALESGAVERRPGVAIPTADPVDGLAHSTRLRAPWSGEFEATRTALAEVGVRDLEAADGDAEAIDGDDHRTIASLVALDVVAAEDASERAADVVAGALRPYATLETDAPFETVGGFADVLEATAQTEPGTGVALAMGRSAAEPALDAWRDHGRRAHGALDGASTGRYDGLFVVGIDDGPIETVARLAADYRSPEPVALAIGDGEVGIATTDGRALGGPLEAIVRDLEADAGLDCEYDVGRRRGYLRAGGRDGDSDADLDDSELITIVRDRL